MASSVLNVDFFAFWKRMIKDWVYIIVWIVYSTLSSFLHLQFAQRLINKPVYL